MEQDIQGKTSGHSGDLLRAGPGHAGQGACVVCVLRQGEEAAPALFEAPFREAQRAQTALLACHVRERDLSHYGEVDMLAPATAMHEFTEYVRALNQEEAEAAFAPLQKAAHSAGLPLQTVSVVGDRGLERLLAQKGQMQELAVFWI